MFSFVLCVCVSHRDFGFDECVLVATSRDVFLHDAETVEATQQEPAAVHPQVKVHFLTCVAAHTHTHTKNNSVFYSMYSTLLYNNHDCITICISNTSAPFSGVV